MTVDADDNKKEFVLVTARYHPDTTSATGQYMTDIAQYLQEQGLDMTVYTQTSASSDPDFSSGEHNVTVNRLPIPELPPRTMLHRSLNWLLFTVGVSLLLLFSRENKRQHEIIFVTYPLILPPAMYLVSIIRGWDCTYIVHDLHPDGAVKLGYVKENGIIHRCWQWVNQRLLLDARKIIALGPMMRERIIDSGGPGLDENKIDVIHHWADGEFIKPRAKDDNWFSEQHGTEDVFTLVYSGNIGEFHDLETIVRASGNIQSENVKILVIGEGDNKQKIHDLAAEKGVLGDTVEMLPYQPWEDVPYSLTAGDVSVIAVDEGFEGLSVSSKLYTALATGQPVLLIAQPNSDEAQVIESSDVGKRASQGDTERVVECIAEWMDNPGTVKRQGRNARSLFEAEFTAEKCLEQYYEALSKPSDSKAEM